MAPGGDSAVMAKGLTVPALSGRHHDANRNEPATPGCFRSRIEARNQVGRIVTRARSTFGRALMNGAMGANCARALVRSGLRPSRREHSS